MNSSLPVYEVYALKYAEAAPRPVTDIAIGADPHNANVPMAYYIWLIRNEKTVIIVDTGFDKEVSNKRGHTFLCSPKDSLQAFGIDSQSVTDVIVTHLHYDHFGNASLFSNATFHIQDKEVAFATGRFMRHHFFKTMFEVEDVVGLVRLIYDDRVQFHDGDDDIVPGITVHLSPGHTPGLQFCRVHTRQGWMVLAADACHYSRLRKQDEVYPVVFDAGGLLEGYTRLKALAANERMIIPGHDPAVMQDYPAIIEGRPNFAVRLD